MTCCERYIAFLCNASESIYDDVRTIGTKLKRDADLYASAPWDRSRWSPWSLHVTDRVAKTFSEEATWHLHIPFRLRHVSPPVAEV